MGVCPVGGLEQLEHAFDAGRGDVGLLYPWGVVLAAGFVVIHPHLTACESTMSADGSAVGADDALEEGTDPGRALGTGIVAQPSGDGAKRRTVQ